MIAWHTEQPGGSAHQHYCRDDMVDREVHARSQILVLSCACMYVSSLCGAAQKYR